MKARSMPWWRGVATAAICMVCAAVDAHAQNVAYHYHVEAAAPRCGQRGTTVEVTMTGFCLQDPKEVIFYRPGIRAVGLTSETNDRFASTLKCTFEIAADCPLGEHPFRVRTAKEISNAATFTVTPFPVVDEDEKTAYANDTIATAVSVTPNVTIRGRLGSSARGDVDVYKIPAVAGQRLSVEIDSVRATDQRFLAPQSKLDTALRILDAAGHELAANDDSALHCQDPVISLVLPTDGFVFVEVRRSFFLEADLPYALHIGSYRRPLAAYPPGGPAGQPLAVTFLGDPLGTFEETIMMPSDPGTFGWFGDAPSPLELRASRFPNVLEDRAAAVTPVPALPAAINGILEKPEDTDAFRVTVKKGDRYLVRAYASTLGSPVDPTIRITPIGADGKPGAVELVADDSKLVERDIFGATPYSGSMVPDTLDPSVVWEPKAEGDYLIEVGDAIDDGGETYVYRVEIEPPPDLVYVVLVSQVYYWQEAGRTTSLAVPRGGRWTVNLFLHPGQGSGFKGDMEIVAHGLPAGVQMVPSRIPAGQAIWPVQLVADETAPEAASLVTFEVKSADPSLKLASRCQQNLPFCSLSSGDAWKTVRLDRFVAGVVEPAPFSIDIDPPSTPILRAGELTVPVRVTRRPGFDQPIEVQCDFIPKGLVPEPKITIPGDQSQATMLISAKADAPLGSQPLVMTANTTGGFEPGWYFGTGRMRVSSKIESITVADPFFALASGPESVRRGERKQYAWKVDHKNPLDGEARVKLLGLPKGVRVIEPLPVVTKDSKEIAFEIEATDEALLGSVKGITCEVTMKTAGQEIRQRTGSGILRIDPKL
jgi:hypothetical protein